MTWPNPKASPEAITNLHAMVPGHLHDGISEYVEHGHPTGHFLTAVFEGDLYRAARHADMQNARMLAEIAKFMIWHAPSASIGSPAKVEAWQAQGGLAHKRSTPVEASTSDVDGSA